MISDATWEIVWRKLILVFFAASDRTTRGRCAHFSSRPLQQPPGWTQLECIKRCWQAVLNYEFFFRLWSDIYGKNQFLIIIRETVCNWRVWAGPSDWVFCNMALVRRQSSTGLVQGGDWRCWSRHWTFFPAICLLLERSYNWMLEDLDSNLIRCIEPIALRLRWFSN